ncbi:MAG: transposase [Clostridia bacterium]|nr:transposase [Clostridia bacterium]
MTEERHLVENGIYHIYNRGNDGLSIFRDSQDRRVFLKKLKALQVQYKFKVLAYSLMGTHYHMVIMDEGITLPMVMNSLQDYYAKYYNSKYNRKGHVFESLYNSIIVVGLLHIFNLVRYVVRNAFAAHIIKDINDYPWDSSRPKKDIYDLVDYELLMNLYDDFSNLPFDEFISNDKDDKRVYRFELHRMTDPQAEELFKRLIVSQTGKQSFNELNEKEKAELIQHAHYLKISKRQLAAITNFSRRTIATICSKTDKEYL